MTEPAEVALPNQPGSAMASWPARTRVVLVTVFGLAVDLWTKSWAFRTLGDKRHVIVDDYLSFQRSENPGALFGMGQHWSPLFIGASLFAMAFVCYVFARSTARQRSFHIGLGCVLSGALGNLFDRLFNNGKVRDFIKIDLRVADHDVWPWIFNIADVLLVVGVGLLMINIWFEKPPAPRPEPEPGLEQ